MRETLRNNMRYPRARFPAHVPKCFHAPIILKFFPLANREIVSLFVREVLHHCEHARPLLLSSSKTDSFSCSVSVGGLPKTRQQSLLHDLWVRSHLWVRNHRADHHDRNLCRGRDHGIHRGIHCPRWLVQRSRSSSCALRF